MQGHATVNDIVREAHELGISALLIESNNYLDIDRVKLIAAVIAESY